MWTLVGVPPGLFADGWPAVSGTGGAIVWTIDPAKTNGHNILSGGNLTVTADLTISTVAAFYATRTFSSSNKAYWESQHRQDGSGFAGDGFSNGVPGFADGAAPHGSNNGIIFCTNGQVYIGATLITTLGDMTGTLPAWRGIAYDGPHGKVWTTLNGTTWNNDIIANQNPVLNVGGVDLVAGSLNAGPYYPSGDNFQDANDNQAMNYGGTAFQFTVPTGFSAVNTF